MRFRLAIPTLALALLSFLHSAAFAHMLYVVSNAERTAFSVVFSDSLAPDTRVEMTKLSGAKLFAVEGGKRTPLSFEQGKHAFEGKLPGSCDYVTGSAVYGLTSQAEKPTLLVYHPKAVVNAKADLSKPNSQADLEITAERNGHNTTFRLWSKGKPVANSEGTLTTGKGEKIKIQTNAEGRTASFHVHGQCAVYLKMTEAKNGSHDGMSYDEVRHYATLVIKL